MDGPVAISSDGERTLADIRGRMSSLASSALSVDDLERELDALAARFRSVIDEQTRIVGGRGTADRKVERDLTPC